MSDDYDENEDIQFRIPEELKVSFEDIFQFKTIQKFEMDNTIYKLINLEDNSFGIGLDNSCFEIYRKTPDGEYQKTTTIVIDDKDKKKSYKNEIHHKIKKIGTLKNGDIIIYIKNCKILKIDKIYYNIINIPIPIDELGQKFVILSEDRLLFYGGDYFKTKSLCIYSGNEPYNKLFNYDFKFRHIYCYEDRRKNYLICLLCQIGDKYDKGFTLNFFDLNNYQLIKEIEDNGERGMFNRIKNHDTAFYPLKDNKLLMYSYSKFIILNLDELIIEKKIEIGIKDTFLFDMSNFLIQKNLLPFMTLERELEEYCDATIDEEDVIKICYFNIDTYEIIMKDELANLLTYGHTYVMDDGTIAVYKKNKDKKELMLYKL